MTYILFKYIQLPLQLEFYGTIEGQAHAAAAAVQKILKKDYSFRPSSEFARAASKASAPTVSITTRKLDWTAQQAALDKMFDQTLQEQYKNLPDIPMSRCFQNISLMDYQVLGIKWLVKRETQPAPAPFYKKVRFSCWLSNSLVLCHITYFIFRVGQREQQPNVSM